MKNTFFINKEVELLSNEIDKIYSIENIGEDNYKNIGRYISLIKTYIENLDALYVDIDREDETVVKGLQSLLDVVHDYIKFNVNLALPSNQSADGLIAFGEFKKIKGYLIKVISILVNNTEYGYPDSILDLIKNFKSYTEARDKTYEIFRKELAEAEKNKQKEIKTKISEDDKNKTKTMKSKK